ncbi:MarR family winged helix-turn-helix transcriptional regulator [uncultured Demequina sp.]|uniref:MarR family winged helix-turn-helix transcriptional regulator n=1 Tax=uncultured Demequina sp. TaxID=693499 RepID=UPI0025CED6B0|nr:MarR family transcriptional regulator [uncultured Demequina sp.]
MSTRDIGSLARKAPLIDGVRHADRETRRRLRGAGTGLAMTGVQAFYAQYLVWAKRGLSMSALADYTRTTNANISQVVRRMERHGLVARAPSDRDGRG